MCFTKQKLWNILKSSHISHHGTEGELFLPAMQRRMKGVLPVICAQQPALLTVYLFRQHRMRTAEGTLNFSGLIFRVAFSVVSVKRLVLPMPYS